MTATSPQATTLKLNIEQPPCLVLTPFEKAFFPYRRRSTPFYTKSPHLSKKALGSAELWWYTYTKTVGLFKVYNICHFWCFSFFAYKSHESLHIYYIHGHMNNDQQFPAV